MLFQTTQAHEELRAKVRAFAEEEIKPIAFMLDQQNEFPDEAIRKLGEMGLMGIPFPAEYGGAGLDALSYAIAVEELHHLGAESLIKIAACPAIQPELEPGTLLAASGAVRGEGATREYIDPSYPAVADMPLLGALLSCGVPDAGLFRSHDCTSLETPWAPGGPARIARWAELGVSALDGETSALFVLASILGMHAASLAYLAENYATGAAAPMDAQARGRLFTAAAEALRCC